MSGGRVVLLDRFELGRIYDGNSLTCLTTDGQEIVLRLATTQEALARTADARRRLGIDTEDDDAMRSYVSNLWAEDWNSPEDSAYDEPQLTWSLVRLWLALHLNKVPAPHCRIRTWILRTIAGGPKHDSSR